MEEKMIVASGFVEVNEERDVPRVVQSLEERGFEVSERSAEKIVYLVEGERAGEVRARIDALKDIPGVRGVYLAYFSLEGADEEGRDESLKAP
jgi:nitrate reductase NapAB chaperone NapD